MKSFPPLELDRIRTYSIKERPSKVSIKSFGRPWVKGGRVTEWIERLPDLLAAKDLKEIVQRLARAADTGRTIILAMGGHPIKVGLAPVIIDLMERGIISLVAVNGSVMIHDTEVALTGATSEDVAASIGSGDFGMVRETSAVIQAASEEAVARNIGLGQALGRRLDSDGFPHKGISLFASAARLGVPITVHVALGTDIVHIHPETDGAKFGAGSLSDFRLFCQAVATLQGGAFINLGSAVILPEVFLKAVSLARNLGCDLDDLTTVNMDFIRHYRPQVNVVERPTAQSGRGFTLIGHHEIMFPLLAAALIEKLAEKGEE